MQDASNSMKTHSACHDPGCAHLQREILALERLVNHYQEELVTSSGCLACGRSPLQATRPVYDDLFEYQQLNALEWTPENGNPHAASYLTKRDGTVSDFHEISLPTSDWEWMSDWRIIIHSKTDMKGWTYALSREDLESDNDCSSERTAAARVRRRRWQRERKYVGVGIENSKGLSRLLEQEKSISALHNVNEKLTDQLRKAYERIMEYEDRVHHYEAKITELQRTQNASGGRPMTNYNRPPSEAPFSPSKSREVLHQTEALLSQMFGSSPLLDDQTIETQRRRSQMVLECHNELDSAVDEFHSLVGKFEQQQHEM